MLQKLNKLKFLLKQNSGSSIVTVMVTMFFVSILGAALLYMAYTGVLVKSTERRGVANYYTASEYMDLVKAGFQEVVSETLGESYKNALKQTGSSSAEAFDEAFLNQLLTWKPETEYDFDHDNIADVDFVIEQNLTGAAGNVSYRYNPDVLAGFLIKAGIPESDISVNLLNNEDTTNATAPIKITSPNGTTSDANIMIVNSDPIDKIVFDEITISYTDPDTNVTTTITSDLVVNIPDFNLLTTEYDVSEIPQYAMIAKDILNNDATALSGKTTYDGSVYAGNINLTTSSTFRNGELITPGTITIEDSTASNEFIVEAASTTGDLYDEGIVWANDIVMGNNTSFTLNGSAFIADDLDLFGNASKVKIDGSYYGFGSDSQNPALSSSILISGFNTSLDLSQVNSLRLAGHSFITSNDSSPTGILMGESISVRPNQLAYLVPESELVFDSSGAGITIRNPVVGADVGPDATLDPSSDLAKNSEISVQKMAYNLPGGQVATYYFLKFGSTTNNIDVANEFFADYFEENSSYISQYLEEYDYLTNIVANTLASGNVVNYTAEDGYFINEAISATSIASDNTSSVFESLTETLSVGSAPRGTNPYNSTVSTQRISSNLYINSNPTGIYEFEDTLGNTVAIITTNNEVIDNDFLINYPHLKILLTYTTSTATAPNVTVTTPFEGLIISEGDINVNVVDDVSNPLSTIVSLKSDEDAVEAAFNAEYAPPSGGASLRFGDFLTVYDSTYNPQDLDSWDVSDIVVYEDWSKANE